MSDNTVLKILMICLAFTLQTVEAASTITKKSSPKKRSHGNAQYLSKKLQKRRFKVSAGVSLNSNLHPISSNQSALNTDLDLTPSYQLTKKITIIGSISGNKDLKGERKFNINDSYIGGVFPIYDFKYASVTGISLAFIPLSKSSKISTLKTAFFIATAVSLKANALPSYMRDFSFDFRPSVRFNFHKYKITLDGKSNSRYSLSGRFRIHYSFTDKLKLSLSNSYSRSITYLGNSKDSYAFSQELSYSLTKEMGLGVGHSKGGSPLAANGKETQIEFFDSKSSNIFTNFSYEY